MINILRTSSDNHDFIELVRLPDADLAIRDGDKHTFYDQFNKIDNVRYVVVAYENNKPAGCGAIKDNIPEWITVVLREEIEIKLKKNRKF